MKNKIIVVGSYIEALVMDVPRLPSIGETIMGNNFRQTWGGKGSNQAVQAARLGADTSFVSMVGNDMFGDKLKRLLENENVNSDHVYCHPTLPTASGFIICTADGQNVITIDIASLQGLGKKEIDESLAKADLNTILLIQLEIPIETAIYACKLGKEKGATVILNPAPAAKLLEFDLSCIDFLTPNETEVRVCVGLEPSDPRTEAEISDLLLELGCKNVIVTLGSEGCLVVNSENKIMIPAYKIGNVVDSTGAGDSFNAALAVALAEGMEIEKATQFGNASAGLSVTKENTIQSFPNRREVDDFIKSDKLS